jgi:predicted metal-dependent peptidase
MEHGFQISGVKRTGAEELKVSMVVKGFRSGLTRQVTLGRRKDTLRLNTGNLVIDIFGSVQGDFKQLSALLSEIQKVLKERLEFVRVT